MSEKRIPLPTDTESGEGMGTVLTFDSRRYRLLDVMSKNGASCLVYKAVCLPTKHEPVGIKYSKAVIKEFYPTADDFCPYIKRDEHGGFVSFSGSARALRFNDAKNRFVDGLKKQVEYYYRNSNHKMDGSLRVYESVNGTAYSVLDLTHGTTIGELTENQRQDLTIMDVAQIILTLCNTIELLHSTEYLDIDTKTIKAKPCQLHLDIKPDNIWLFDKEPSKEERRIALFDFDTLAEKGEVSINVPYSVGFAPPEQRNGKTGDIAETADIYAIGATLYWLLTKRDVSFLYDNDITAITETVRTIRELPICKGQKNSANPAGINLIEKTLIAALNPNILYRYQNVKLIRDNMVSAISYLRNPIYLVAQPVEATIDFCGRDEKIAEIDAVLKENQWVNIVGMPGIGKTEVARKYAEINRAQFHTICLTVYTGELKSTIAGLRFANDPCRENADLEERFRVARDVLDKTDVSTLLIVDNFDFEMQFGDDGFDKGEMEICNWLRHLNNGNGAKIIFTTRNRCYYDRPYPQEVEIDYLPLSVAIELFQKHCAHTNSGEFSPQINYLVDDIICRHTLSIILVANYLNGLTELSGIVIKDVADRLRLTAEKLSNNKDIRSYKDRYPNYPRIDTIYAHTKALVDFSKFTSEQRTVMCCLSFVPMTGVPLSQCANLLSDKSIEKTKYKECIELLVEKSWLSVIYSDAQSIVYLHPIISDVVFNTFKPQITHSDKNRFVFAAHYMLNATMPWREKMLYAHINKNIFVKFISAKWSGFWTLDVACNCGRKYIAYVGKSNEVADDFKLLLKNSPTWKWWNMSAKSFLAELEQ